MSLSPKNQATIEQVLLPGPREVFLSRTSTYYLERVMNEIRRECGHAASVRAFHVHQNARPETVQ